MDRKMKKLNRAELLEMLLTQTREVERLRAELEQTKLLLNAKQLTIAEAGSLAEAVLKLNGVYTSIQAAADQYLQNIQDMQRRTEAKCREMEEQTAQRCEALLRYAELTARRKAEQASEIMEDAQWQQLLDLLDQETDK